MTVLYMHTFFILHFIIDSTQLEKENSRQIFAKHSNTKFHENPSSGSWDVPCGDGRTDLTKLIVTFRNFAKAP